MLLVCVFCDCCGFVVWWVGGFWFKFEVVLVVVALDLCGIPAFCFARFEFG